MASSSGIFSVTGQVIIPASGPALYGVTFFNDGTHASSVTLYSGTGAVAGNELATAAFPASSPNTFQSIIFKNPMASTVTGLFGLYAVVTGTGAGGILYWEGGA